MDLDRTVVRRTAKNDIVLENAIGRRDVTCMKTRSCPERIWFRPRALDELEIFISRDGVFF